MSDERPETLLKSALEKIIYFEARSEQLTNDVAAARDEAARLKIELAHASQREIELRRTLAEKEVQLTQARREHEESARLIDALRGERAQQLGKLLEAAQVHATGAEQDMPFDLAAFIAQLRSEVLTAIPETRPGATAARAERTNRPETSEVEHATRFRSEGRLGISDGDVAQLAPRAGFAGRSEETLFGFSIRELAAPDAGCRLRAAQRLKAIANAAAAPALAAALGSERDPLVAVEMLAAFCALAKTEGVHVVLPLVQSPSPDVRIAALKGLLALDPDRAAPHLSAALKDPDRSVRRRAALLALGLQGELALSLGEQAIADSDAEVRRVGALSLGASGGVPAKSRLLTALRDPDTRVREAAAQSLSRLLGENVSGVVPLDELQRRREIRRLSGVTPKPVIGPPAPKMALPARTAPVPAMAVVKAPARVAVVEEPEPVAPPVVNDAFAAQVLAEIRCAIRGRTAEDLATALHTAPGLAADAAEQLCTSGQLVKRGQKFFMA